MPGSGRECEIAMISAIDFKPSLTGSAKLCKIFITLGALSISVRQPNKAGHHTAQGPNPSGATRALFRLSVQLASIFEQSKPTAASELPHFTQSISKSLAAKLNFQLQGSKRPFRPTTTPIYSSHAFTLRLTAKTVQPRNCSLATCSQERSHSKFNRRRW